MIKAILLAVIVWVAICYGLCINAGRNSRMEERKELEDEIKRMREERDADNR